MGYLDDLEEEKVEALAAFQRLGHRLLGEVELEWSVFACQNGAHWYHLRCQNCKHIWSYEPLTGDLMGGQSLICSG